MNWIRVEDPSRFLDAFAPKLIDPRDRSAWRSFWRDRKRKVIEGYWFEDFNGWRYGPGNIGFYRHYCTIFDLDEDQLSFGHKTRPLIRDIEWHRAYYVMEARGFSGFADDPKVTCDHLVLDAQRSRMRLSDKRHTAMLRDDGTFKEYCPPREYLFAVHDEPLGRPLYYNNACNHMEFGSRGGGKSLFYGLAVVKYELCTDGIKNYTDQMRSNPPAALIDVGAGTREKSDKTLASIKLSLNELGTQEKFGTWGTPDRPDYEPCPLFKRMSGWNGTNLEPGTAWKNHFRIKYGKDWKDMGTGSAVHHKIYTDKTTTGAQSGAGGRRNLILYEEVGLMMELPTTWGSDDAVVRIDAKQFGSKFAIGTSGNVKTITGAREVFTHPREYNCLAFEAEDGQSEQCFFLPAYMTDKRFKDEQGNTDVQAAQEFYQRELEEKMATGNPEVINAYKMNYPTEVEHMWVEQMGTLLPRNEAEKRIKELTKGNLYEKIGRPVELVTGDDGFVEARTLHQAEPFYTLSFSDRLSFDGPVMIYSEPYSRTPRPDAYIATYDPQVADDPRYPKRASINVVQIWASPQYAHMDGFPAGELVATYMGRHPNGNEAFYREMLKLFDYYGIGQRGVWYEANKGDRFRGFMISARRAYMLCLQPQFEQGKHIFRQNTTKTGFLVHNRFSLLELINRAHDFLLDKTKDDKPNIYKIPCIFTLRQIAAYDLDPNKNFDAVSALLGFPLAIAEREHTMERNQRKRNSGQPVNPLAAFTRPFKTA